MITPGSVTIKVVLDTTEAEAKLAALQAKAANLQAKADALQDQTGLAGGKIPAGYPLAWCDGLPPVSKYIVEIAETLDGCRISQRDAGYLIDCIRSRTR